MKKSKVVHNRKRCIGCHSCVEIAPQSWLIDEQDGKAVLIGAKKKGSAEHEVYVGEVFECDLEPNKKAAKACPMGIIKVD